MEYFVNGTPIHCEVSGEGKPVILLHRNGGSHCDLNAEAEMLTGAGYRVYAPDSRGQGANAPLSEYHYMDMAEDIYQLINKAGLCKPALYGYSDGGIIGLLIAIEHPDTLSLLAISGANLTPNGMLDEITASLASEEDLSPLYRLMADEPDIKTDQLARINIPVLVTAGSADIIKEEHTREIAAALPLSELHILEGQDHGSYIHDSEIMGGMLLDFLKKHGY